MSSNFDKICSMHSQVKNMKKRFFILYEGEKTEAKYIEWIEERYSKDKRVEIINCGESTMTTVENLVKLRNNADDFQPEVDESFYIIDLDIFKPGLDKLEENLKLISKEFNVIYSKPSFEFWILLHYENISKLALLKDIDVHGIKERLKKYNVTFNGKKLRDCNKEFLMNNMEKACLNANKIIMDINPSYYKLNEANIKNILSIEESITNMNMLIDNINEKCK